MAAPLPRWFPFIWLGVGGLMLGGAFLAWKVDRDFAARAERAEGVVVALEPGNKGRKAVVEFVAGGERVRFKDSMSSSPPAYDVGERVEVLHDREDPSNALIDRFWSRHLAAVILGGLGSVFFLVGLVLTAIPAARGR